MIDYNYKLMHIEVNLRIAEEKLTEMENKYFKEIKEANANENDNRVNGLLYDLKHKRGFCEREIEYLKKKQISIKKKLENQLSRNIIYMTRNDLN
jgi:hypothetical protein